MFSNPGPRPKFPKSRSGCGRCKDRRRKCDESVPNCLQCSKRNLRCPGYEQRLRWSTKYEAYHSAHTKQTIAEKKIPASSSASKPDRDENATFLSVTDSMVALTAALGAEMESQSTYEDRTADAVSWSSDTSSQLELLPTSVVAPTEDDRTPSSHIAEEAEKEAVVTDDMDAIFLTHAPLDFEFFDLVDLTVPNTVENGWQIDATSTGEDFLDISPLETPVYPTEPKANHRPSQSLLLDFYRLPQSTMGMTSMMDTQTLLVQHYFQNVCAIFSSFDSGLNPFRTTIGRIWQQSQSTNYAIQSMAAAHLANTFPSMALIGTQLQTKAWQTLQNELSFTKERNEKWNTSIIFTLLLLGLTTSWHKDSALGLEYLFIARSLLFPELLRPARDSVDMHELQFVEESLLHWEMLLGFMTDDTRVPSSPLKERCQRALGMRLAKHPSSNNKILPHPWTGVAPTIHFLFAEIGRLVRRERFSNKHLSVDFVRRHANSCDAQSLEEALLAFEVPSLEDIAETEDINTPREHLILIAEAYRSAGLLELYRTFPSILHDRLADDVTTKTGQLKSALATLQFDWSYSEGEADLWRVAFALHVLRLIDSIPASSGTFCHQPLLFVIVASELRLLSLFPSSDLFVNDANVLRSRSFVMSRMHDYALRFPYKPLHQMVRLVKETWLRLDAGEDVCWMDVMDEHGWRTII